jgi:histidyl-tRNA synthetase
MPRAISGLPRVSDTLRPLMASPHHIFQAPKGMRDFFPEDMAIRHHLEQSWRSASIRHGFDEINGPTFEHLELYTIKSGDGIVSELFSFQRSGGQTDYALRAEFTPTLARMAAAKGRSLAVPTKWFAIPDLFRAERPQKGRLREHRQWNVDILGVAGPEADAEVIAVAVAALRGLGLGAEDIRVRISHRGAAASMLMALGVPESRISEAFGLIDKREKLPPEVFAEQAAALGIQADDVTKLDEMTRTRIPGTQPPASIAQAHGLPIESVAELDALARELDKRGLLPFCDWDLGIVRGLAYYTGTVWEIHDARGTFRAIAGGGRYDGLVEMFKGPSTPACGFGMGDVVLALLLADRGLLDGDTSLCPRPDVFVLSSGHDQAEELLVPLSTGLRDIGLHVRHTWKASRNIGKQFKEAANCRARIAVVLGEEVGQGMASVKDLDASEQFEVSLGDLPTWITRRLAGGVDRT